MWILVSHLASQPNANLVSIRNDGSNETNGLEDGKQHVSVWVLPKGLGVIDNVWCDEKFVSIRNGSNSLTLSQMNECVAEIANRALRNGNGK